MKNKFKILFMFLLMFPFVINAAEVSLSCPSSVNSGGSVTCSININSGSALVAGFQANVNASNGLSYKSYSMSSGWAGSSSSSSFLVYGNKVSGSKTLGTYVYTASGNSNDKLTVSLSGISVSDENGNSISSNTSVSASIRIKCSDNNLKGLSVDGVSVSDFNKDTLSYNITTEKASINISATANSGFSSVSGTGNKSVKYGKNVFDIVVTSESGVKKIYKINVTRPDNRENINTLNSLGVVGQQLNPSFSSKTNSYKLTVKADVSSIDIKASKTSTNSSFVSGFGERKVNLNYGVNNVLIKVKAENESINTYTIVVTREDNRSSNNYLNSLSLSDGKIKFDKNTVNYSIVTDKDSIEVKATCEDSKATVSGLKTYDLVDGLNEIKIVVTAENASKKEYIIKVTKTDKIEDVVSSNNLSNLIVGKYSLNFSKDVYEYEVEIDEESKLDLSYDLEDENSIIEVVGNENLKNGSVVTLKVTGINGETKEYKIKVLKKADEKNNKGNINIVLVILLIISVIGNLVLGFLLVSKNKKDTNEVSNNVNNIEEGNE